MLLLLIKAYGESNAMSASESKSNKLTERQILKARKADCMNADQLEFFRERLLELHESTCARIEEAERANDQSHGF